jgi:signal transduction histidine kinase
MPFILDIADFVIVIKNHELLEYSEQELGVYDLIVNYAKHLYENKRFADDMLHAQKELEHKKHTEVIGNLVAGVAHEINTPVQYISDNVNFVTETFSQMKPAYYKTSYIDVENDDVIKKVKEIQEYFKEIDSDYTMEEIYDALCQSRDGIEQISQIVSALKIFMHPGSKEKERININDIIENALIISRSEWKRVAKIKKDLDKDLPLIDAHKNELSQALLNLIVNAAHAVEKRHKQSLKGQIEITTKVVNFRVEIIIKDNGIGMDKETKARMYEPFFTTKQTGKGTGQGLYLAYDTVVSKHGGKIRCQSTQGKGTTFKLILNTPTTS